MASHAIPRTAAGVCRNGGRDLPDALSTKQRESTMRESRSLTEHRRIGMSGVRMRGEGASENRAAHFQSGPLDNRQLQAVVNGARVASRHSLHPNTKKRACFFHTPYNQSVFQSRGWFLPGNASLVDATFGLASRSNAMREKKRRDTGGRESSTRGGSCRGYSVLCSLAWTD